MEMHSILFIKCLYFFRNTIVFDSNGGKEIETITVKKGEEIVLPTTEKDGYNFIGWYDENSKKAELLKVSDNTDISSLRVVMSNSHGCKQMDDLLKKYGFTNFVKKGSSLKGCMIANGEADVYYRFNPTMEWVTKLLQKN